MINLNQLRAFYHTAKNQSFSRAAEALFVSQPAVNAQVKLLEQTCGLKLLVSIGRTIQLTEEGNVLFEKARKIFEVEREIEETLEELKNLHQGTLRLGTARTYARYFMPLLVSTFRQAHPYIQIHLTEGSSLEIIRSLRELRTQLAIVSQTGAEPRISFIPYWKEEVVLLLPPNHPLSGEKVVEISDFISESMIMKEPGSGTRRLVDGLLAEKTIRPKILMETSDAEMIKMLVQHGEGIAFLVRVAALTEIREKRLITVPLKEGNPYLNLGVASLKDHPLSPPAQAFMKILKGLVKPKRDLHSVADLLTHSKQ